MRLKSWCWVVGLMFGVSPWVAAQSPIPDSLKPWIPWVLEGEASRTCTLKAGALGSTPSDFVCTAATPVRFAPDGEGTRFSVRVRLEQAGEVDVPGDADKWPQQLSVNGQPAVVRRDPNSGLARIVLPAGEHAITGRWPERPERIRLPATYGAAVWGPDERELRREGDYAWLTRTGPAPTAVIAAPKDAMTVQVWRRLEDGPVLRLTTRVLLSVSGSPRTLVLGPVLPSGFVPLSWRGDVPAVLGRDGRLHVQVAPGESEVVLEARCTQQCAPAADGLISAKALARPVAPAPWPAQEVWTVQPNPAFRQLTVDGAGVDPAQANVPGEWQAQAAYRVAAGQGLGLKQASRGRRAGEGESLNVQRETWLDEDGWIVRDHLTGTLPVGGRLAMQRPYVLGRVEADGRPWPLSVDGEGAVGLEWGRSTVDVQSQSRRPKGRAPITGWQATVDNLSVQLHLPPAHVLMAAPGAKHGSGSWVDNLTLLSFFGVALFAMLMRQALGNRAAFVAGAAALGWVGVGGAVWLCWWLALAVIAHLVFDALPVGRLRRFVGWGRPVFLVCFALGIIGFAGEQMRLALHPQLEGAYSGGWSSLSSYTQRDGYSNSLEEGAYQDMGSDSRAVAGKEMATPMPVMEAMAPPPAPVAPTAPTAAGAIGAGPSLTNALSTDDPLAGIGLAQAGEPLPAWSYRGIGRNYNLVYQGPIRGVDNTDSYAGPFKADTATLWVAPPWMVRPLRVLGVAALLWLALALTLRIVRHSGKPLPVRLPDWTRRLGLALLLVPVWAHASAPMPPSEPTMASADTLAELKRRLTLPPACAPVCATLMAANLNVQGDEVVVTYRVSVQRATTWSLPAVEGASRLDVQVDGASAWFVEGGAVALMPGQARITARYRAQGDRIRVAFDVPPPEASQTLGAGWSGEGVSSDRLPTGAWVLERQAKAAASTDKNQNQVDQLPPGASIPVFVRVERVVEFGRDITLVTTVLREDISAGGAVVLIPKVSGEAPQSEKLTEENGAWKITFAPGERTQTWRSRITPPATGIAFKAVGADVGAESWRIVPGPAWTLKLSGVPEAPPQPTGAGLVRQVLPLGGETLVLLAARLPAAQGNLQRVDEVGLTTTAGPRDAEHVLTMKVVATQAGERTLKLPESSVLIDVRSNGQPLSVPLQGRELLLPVVRGEQRLEVTFRTVTQGAWLTAPKVDLGGPSANVLWQLKHDQTRWVLSTHGPGWGTAVLYWSQLVVLLALAWVLSKLPGRLFTLPAALLLALGFSTFYASAIVWLALWRAWTHARATPPAAKTRLWFNVQQVAFVLFSLLTVCIVVGAIMSGLLGAQPDMLLRTPNGLETFQWLLDRAPAGELSGPVVFSAPMWLYRVLLFAWSLWFARWLIGAARQAFSAWTSGGYWRSKGEVADQKPTPSTELEASRNERDAPPPLP